MTWIKRTEPATHRCQPPTYTRHPDGQPGDLWRCDTCRVLWRIANACEVCSRLGTSRPHHGMHDVGTRWRIAPFWQQLVHDLRRR